MQQFENMIDKEKIRAAADEAVKDTDKFVVEVKVAPDNTIEVFVDSDTFVTIDDCATISRFIEQRFDRDVEDYCLSVFSYGLCGPLKMERQFRKYIDKDVEIKQKGHPRVTAKLVSFEGDAVKVVVEQKNKKKKKEAEQNEVVTLSLKEVEVRPAIVF